MAIGKLFMIRTEKRSIDQSSSEEYGRGQIKPDHQYNDAAELPIELGIVDIRHIIRKSN